MAEFVESGLAARLKKHDVHLVCVSLGKVEQAKRWLDITRFEGELYVDEKTYGDPSKGVEPPQSESYGIFSLKRSVSALRLDDPDASKLAAETALQHPDLEELAEKDGTMTIWPGDVFQTGGGEAYHAVIYNAQQRKVRAAFWFTNPPSSNNPPLHHNPKKHTAFVLGPGNVCDFAYRSKFAGDHPSISDLVQYSIGLEEATGEEIIYDSTRAWLKWMRMEGKVMVGFGGSIVSDTATQRLIVGATTVWKKFGLALGVGLAGGILGLKLQGEGAR